MKETGLGRNLSLTASWKWPRSYRMMQQQTFFRLSYFIPVISKKWLLISSMATTVGLIKGATEAILGIGEVCKSQASNWRWWWLFVAGLRGQLHLQVVLQVVSLSLYSGQRRGGLQSVLRRANILRDGKWWPWCSDAQGWRRILQADDSVDEEVLNHYCWMFSQFDIPPDFKVSWPSTVLWATIRLQAECRKHNMNGRFPVD